MVQFDPRLFLPTAEDLPDSDDTPVDNELQLLVPMLLRAILALNWDDRLDWFLGVNMGLYYQPGLPAIVPDGFLSLGVPRYQAEGKLRLSYLLWQENMVPQWVLEVVSRTPGGEYTDKLALYAEIGVRYYLIYNPDYFKRDKHDVFELYRLEQGRYVRQSGNPIWMPELNLAIGSELGTQDRLPREWLYWYDQQGQRLPAPGNVIQQERQRAEQERQRAEQAEQKLQTLLDRLRQSGINPDEL